MSSCYSEINDLEDVPITLSVDDRALRLYLRFPYLDPNKPLNKINREILAGLLYKYKLDLLEYQTWYIINIPDKTKKNCCHIL